MRNGSLGEGSERGQKILCCATLAAIADPMSLSKNIVKCLHKNFEKLEKIRAKAPRSQGIPNQRRPILSVFSERKNKERELS